MHEHDEFIKEDSIILSVKKLLGLVEDDDSFDLDVVLHINAALSVLYQLGILQIPFTVDSIDDTWENMLPGATDDVKNQVKMYLFYKTKLGFDSTTLGSTVIEVIKESIKEIEWRLMATFNPKDTFE